jgi:hypothetical protein
MLYLESFAVYSKNQIKLKNTLFGQNSEALNVNYIINHRALKL